MSLALWSGVKRPGEGRLEHAQLARLFRIVVMLQSEPYPNARAISEHCEVCRRTVHRDLHTLEAAGVPIRYDAERRGYYLGQEFFLPPQQLSEAEGLSLLLLSRRWDDSQGLGLSSTAQDGALKLTQVLETGVRRRVLALTEAYEFDPLRPLSPARIAVRKALLGALTRPNQLRIWYRENADREQECTKFGLYRLVLRGNEWYLVGRSSLVRRVVVIGLNWVDRAILTDDPYDIPPRFNLQKFLARSWQGRGRENDRVWLRLSAVASENLRFDERHRVESRERLPDGRLVVHLGIDGLDELFQWVLGFGDQVDLIGPPKLVRQLKAVVDRIDPALMPPPRINPRSHE